MEEYDLKHLLAWYFMYLYIRVSFPEASFFVKYNADCRILLR